MANILSETFLLSFLIFQLTFVNYSSAEDFATFRKLICGDRADEKHAIIYGQYQFDPVTGANCTYPVEMFDPSVRQLLIQFGFNMTQPTSLTNYDSFMCECKSDYVEIDGTRYCGYEASQHLYLPFSIWSDQLPATSTEIRLVLSPRPPICDGCNYPKFFMTIEQLQVGEGRLAPNGCTRYFSQKSGIITSFNYRDGRGIYPAGLNYTICIRHPLGVRALRLKFLDFNLNGQLPVAEESLQAGQYCVDGDADSLSIPRSVVEPVTAADFLNTTHKRFCGRTLNKKIVYSEYNNGIDKFFHMRFESKSMFRKKTESGFRVEYQVMYERDFNRLS